MSLDFGYLLSHGWGYRLHKDTFLVFISSEHENKQAKNEVGNSEERGYFTVQNMLCHWWWNHKQLEILLFFFLCQSCVPIVRSSTTRACSPKAVHNTHKIKIIKQIKWNHLHIIIKNPEHPESDFPYSMKTEKANKPKSSNLKLSNSKKFSGSSLWKFTTELLTFRRWLRNKAKQNKTKTSAKSF